jgi:hypothetical protein
VCGKNGGICKYKSENKKFTEAYVTFSAGLPAYSSDRYMASVPLPLMLVGMSACFLTTPEEVAELMYFRECNVIFIIRNNQKSG